MSWLVPLLERQLLVLCGSGGVGKTTTASAIAVEAAVRGQRVLVMTIDPARRLAESLGLAELGNAETQVDLVGRLQEPVAGTLHAMMLDTSAAFDELLQRIAHDPADVERLRENRVFRMMLKQMVGVQEYLAGEKVYDTVRSGRYDLVVLDTPPTRNALDFLDAPVRISALLDERIVRWFLPGVDDKATGGGTKLLRRLVRTSGNVVKKVLGRVFGTQLLDEIESFLYAFSGVRHEFRTRSSGVVELMGSSATAFLLVSTTSEIGLREALYFREQIARRRLPFAGFIVNRLHLPLDEPGAHPERRPLLVTELRAALRGAAGSQAAGLAGFTVEDAERLASALQDNVSLINRLAEHDRSRLAHLLRAAGGGGNPPLVVPLLAEEVNDLPALRRVAGHLTR